MGDKWCHRPPPLFKDGPSGWSILLHFQTVCLLWPRCLQCCPQRDDFSPSDVSGQQCHDLEELALLCYSIMKKLFYIPNVHICAGLATLNIIKFITLFLPGCFILRMDNFLTQPVARFEVNRDMFIEHPLEFLWGLKQKFCLVPVSDRPCQFMCDPNYFMSFMRLWDSSTPTLFLQFFCDFAQMAHYSRSVSLATLCLPPLPLTLLLLLQTWHWLWVWPADDWLFCLKSHLSFCVRFIVQLVVMRRELARFIDTGTDPHKQRHLTERVGPRLQCVAGSSAPWTDKSQWSEFYKAPSIVPWVNVSFTHSHSYGYIQETDRKQKQHL